MLHKFDNASSCAHIDVRRRSHECTICACTSVLQGFNSHRNHTLREGTICQMDNDLIPKDGGFSSKMTVVVGSIKLQGHCLGFCAGEITHVFSIVGVHCIQKKSTAPWNMVTSRGLRLTHMILICALFSSAISVLQTFGRRSDFIFIPAFSFSRKVHVLTVVGKFASIVVARPHRRPLPRAEAKK